MSEAKETYEELDAIYRYKKSILIDSFIVAIFMILLFILIRKYLSTETIFSTPLRLFLFLIFFTVFFLSDRILNWQVSGKKYIK